MKDQPRVRYWIRPGVNLCMKIRYSVHSIKDVLVPRKQSIVEAYTVLEVLTEVLWSSCGSTEENFTEEKQLGSVLIGRYKFLGGNLIQDISSSVNYVLYNISFCILTQTQIPTTLDNFF